MQLWIIRHQSLELSDITTCPLPCYYWPSLNLYSLQIHIPKMNSIDVQNSNQKQNRTKEFRRSKEGDNLFLKRLKLQQSIVFFFYNFFLFMQDWNASFFILLNTGPKISVILAYLHRFPVFKI